MLQTRTRTVASQRRRPTIARCFALPQEATPEEKLNIAKYFVRQTPPGHIDVTIAGEAAFRSASPPFSAT